MIMIIIIIINIKFEVRLIEHFSKNRQAILDCLRGTTVHPTAEWIYEQLRPDFPTLSLATVYRNLCQLKEAGTIASMGVVAGQEHFEGNLIPHAHVFCCRCGRIDDLPLSPESLSALQGAQDTTGFAVSSVQFVGLCPACAGNTEKTA